MGSVSMLANMKRTEVNSIQMGCVQLVRTSLVGSLPEYLPFPCCVSSHGTITLSLLNSAGQFSSPFSRIHSWLLRPMPMKSTSKCPYLHNRSALIVFKVFVRYQHHIYGEE
jgi:hypothetical protein